MIHVYYDNNKNQFVLFEATLDSTYEFIFSDGEVKTFRFKDLDTFQERLTYTYIGAL